MDKIIEMTVDGRLSIMWVGLTFMVIAIVIEVLVYLDYKRSRRAYLRKHYPNTHRWLK